jgi:hypothetical protein
MAIRKHTTKRDKIGRRQGIVAGSKAAKARARKAAEYRKARPATYRAAASITNLYRQLEETEAQWRALSGAHEAAQMSSFWEKEHADKFPEYPADLRRSEARRHKQTTHAFNQAIAQLFRLANAIINAPANTVDEMLLKIRVCGLNAAERYNDLTELDHWKVHGFSDPRGAEQALVALRADLLRMKARD